MKTKYTFVLTNNSKIVLTEEGEAQLTGEDIDKIMNSKNIIVLSTATDSLKIRPSQISAIHVTQLQDGKSKYNKIEEEMCVKDNIKNNDFYELLDDNSDFEGDEDESNIIIENDEDSQDDIETISELDLDEDDENELDTILSVNHEDELNESMD